MAKIKLLTVIIPFLNEKEEVKNTIESILEFSDNNVSIIVINDASDDSYDYDNLDIDYDIEYIKNENRLGVAASRDLGVILCKTPYFLLLDAHMRFYDNKWVERITNTLSKSKKLLLCTQTKVLKKKDGVVFVDEVEDANTRQGATVELYNGGGLFEPVWSYSENMETDNKMTPIACILGAGYACSKKYWTYLRGLEGLIHYGSDEPYISIKVWMNGGKCVLLQDVAIGHIYREQAPYSNKHFSREYNRLLINELLIFDDNKYRKHFSHLKKAALFGKAYLLIHKNREKISELKEYYSKILKNDFLFFEEINNNMLKKNNVNHKKEILHEIANYLLIRCYSFPKLGILKGKMGIIIFLFHYYRHTNSEKFNELSTLLLEDLCNLINSDTDYSFESGLSGIGWGIQYLFLQNFISGDINDILEDFDLKIENTDIINMEDFSFNTGLCGIVQYINARLFVVENLKLKNPFNNSFLLRSIS